MKLKKIILALTFVVTCIILTNCNSSSKNDNALPHEITPQTEETYFRIVTNGEPVIYRAYIVEGKSFGKKTFKLVVGPKDDYSKPLTLKIDEAANHLEFYKDWTGKDLTWDNNPEIVLEFKTGGNCNTCKGLLIYSFDETKIKKLEVKSAIKGASLSINDIQHDSDIPKIIGVYHFYISELSHAFTPSILEAFSWNLKTESFSTAENTVFRNALIVNQTEKVIEKLDRAYNSDDYWNDTEMYQATLETSLISKYLMTKPELKTLKKDQEGEVYFNLVAANLRCTDDFHNPDKCKKMKVAVDKFLKTYEIKAHLSGSRDYVCNRYLSEITNHTSNYRIAEMTERKRLAGFYLSLMSQLKAEAQKINCY